MRLILFVLFFSFSFTTINAQSKTERAVKKLRSNKIYTNDNDDDDDDDNGFLSNLLGDFFSAIFEGIFSDHSNETRSSESSYSRRSSYSYQKSYEMRLENELRNRRLHDLRQNEINKIKPEKLQPIIKPKLKETKLIFEEPLNQEVQVDTIQIEIIEETVDKQIQTNKSLSDFETEEVDDFNDEQYEFSENYEFIAFPYVSEELNKNIKINKHDDSRAQWEIWTGNNSEQKTIGLAFTYEELAYNVNFKYQNLKEHIAPFDINQLSMTLGLKPMSNEYISFDFNGGLHSIFIDEENFGGITIGAGLALYPIQPISMEFKGNLIFGDGTNSSNSDVSLNIHLDRIKLGFGLNYLNLQGVEFNTLQVKLGLYF